MCESDRTMDFSVQGSQIEGFDGHLVWAVAVDREEPGTPRRVVRLEGVIRDGGFSLTCARALRVSYAYPSWTVVIDATEDGACSPADRQVTEQLYGWADPLIVDVTRAANGEVQRWEATVADARTAVGDRSTFDFCKEYFDDGDQGQTPFR